MITDFIIKSMTMILYFYNTYIHPHIGDLLTHINEWQNYTSTFQTYLGGVYFILGKSLIVFIITTFGIILVVRLFFAVLNIVGQYVP